MDRQTVFTKTAKGLKESTGKTSALSRDMRALLNEIDGKASFGDVHAKLGKVPEAKLSEALQLLAKNDFIRELAPAKAPVEVDIDLDFTMAIPTLPSLAKQAEEEARQKAQAATEAAARAKAEAVVRAKIEAEIKAKTAAEAAARAEAKARAEREAREHARRQAEEAEQRAREEAERQRREAEEKARREAEEQARREAEERARLEAEQAEQRAREEAERQAREEAERQRREAEEKARRDAEEQARREAEERARREAEEAEQRAREEAERQAREEAERQRRDAEEKARRDAKEQARRETEERAGREAEEAEQRAREEAEHQAREEAERQRRDAEENARRGAEEQAKREAEEAKQRAREEAERQAREEAELQRREAEKRAGRDAKERARREAKEAEQRAREDAERQAREEAERQRREAEELARRDAEEQGKREAEERARQEAKKAEQHAGEHAAGEAAQQAAAQEPPDSSLEDMVKIETDFDAVLSSSGDAIQDAARRQSGEDDTLSLDLGAQARSLAEDEAAGSALERDETREQARTDAQEERGREDEAEPAKEDAPSDVDALAALHERERAEREAQTQMDAQNAETERHFADMEKELEAEGMVAPTAKTASEEPARAPSRKERNAQQRERAAEAAQEHAAEIEIEAEPAPADYATRTNWGKPVALALFVLLLLGVVLVHFISFDGYIPQFEKLAGSYMQQPVKIKAMHLSLFPRPQWRLEGVSVGKEGALTVARVNAVPELGSMFSDKKTFTTIELESPVLGEQDMLDLLFGRPAGPDFKVQDIVANDVKLNSKTFVLPALNAKIAFGVDGVWRQIALETPDRKTSVSLKHDGETAQLEIETNAFSLPLHPEFILENFVARGVMRREELKLNEFKGGLYNGYLSGNASLKWGAGWSLTGEVGVRAMDPARFAPALVEDGKLEGSAAFAMRAKSYDELFETPRLEGKFDIFKGTLLGVDLGRILQGGSVGGKTAFLDLAGRFVREAGNTQLRQIVLAAGPVLASGAADVDAGKHLGGRFAVELKSPVAHARANLTLSGSLGDPRFSR